MAVERPYKSTTVGEWRPQTRRRCVERGGPSGLDGSMAFKGVVGSRWKETLDRSSWHSLGDAYIL